MSWTGEAKSRGFFRGKFRRDGANGCRITTHVNVTKRSQKVTPPCNGFTECGVVAASSRRLLTAPKIRRYRQWPDFLRLLRPARGWLLRVLKWVLLMSLMAGSQCWRGQFCAKVGAEGVDWYVCGLFPFLKYGLGYGLGYE
jgi:hypothetical protein